MSATQNSPAPAQDFDTLAKAAFELGPTPVIASKYDPRFCYCLYVPPTLDPANPPELVVAMHGTGRSFITYRDQLAGFARWHNCIVLAPLFPIGPRGDGNRDGFKYMIEGDIRYDQVLLAMVAEIEAQYGLSFPQFAIFGYSGGAHFTHRFLMLHPERLWAASIGAPGSVTLLDPTRDWWVGTRNLADLFGKAPNPEAMARIAVQMIVGDADLETWEITHTEGSRHWMPDANHAGRTRPERLDRLRENFEEHGVKVRFNVIPNMAHDGTLAVPVFEDFLADTLAQRRKATRS